MAKDSKIKVTYAGTIESRYCKDCVNGLPVNDKFVFCKVKTAVKYSNQVCKEFDRGEQKLYESDLEKIIDIYLSNKDMIQYLTEVNDGIKFMLVRVMEEKVKSDKLMVGKYLIKLMKYTQKKLDTEKAKGLLMDLTGKSPDELKVTKEIEVKYPKIVKL